MTENEFCQTLRAFLPEEKLEEVEKLLREVRISIFFICTYIPIKLFSMARLKHLSFVDTFEQGDVVQLVNEQYRDWSNSQTSGLKPYGEEQDKESFDKEKIAAVFEKLVQCCEPVISADGEGKFQSDLITGHFRVAVSVNLIMKARLTAKLFK